MMKTYDTPVSYTHLDVYKRQVYRSLVFSLIRFKCSTEVWFAVTSLWVDKHLSTSGGLYHQKENLCHRRNMTERQTCLLYTSRCV